MTWPLRGRGRGRGWHERSGGAIITLQMSLAPGVRVGGYEVVAKLGEGGMGEVYRARDVRLNRDVALKTLPILLADDPDRLQRFKREAHVLASLNHANIAAIYGLEDHALYEITLDSGRVDRLTTPADGEVHEPEEWSPTENTLLFSVTKNREISLWTYSLPGRSIAPFGTMRSSFPTGARFSRDGRWVAYTVRAAERGRIYVESLPVGRIHELPVSGNNIAAHKVGWSADGNELFYIPRIREFEAVRVTTQPDFRFGEVAKVPRPFENPGGPTMRTQYDITPSGKFVGLFPPGDTGQNVPALFNQIEVVLNWTETLRAR